MSEIRLVMLLIAFGLIFFKTNAQQRISFKFISETHLFAHPLQDEKVVSYTITKDKNGREKKIPRYVILKKSELNKFIGGVSSIEIIDKGAFYHQFLDINGDHKADILINPEGRVFFDKDYKIDFSTKSIRPGFQNHQKVDTRALILQSEKYRKEHFLFVSDHYPEDGRSYALIGSIYGSVISEVCLFDGVDNAESVRYSDRLRMIFYSFENSTSTGVASLKLYDTSFHSPKILFEESIPSTNTSDNRGIEAITLSSNNYLWMAFESGGGTYCGDTTVAFYKVPVDTTERNFDFEKKIKYEYLFNRCRCLKEQKRFDGSIGNGISEILAFKDDTTRFLVLERCFEAPPADVKLYIATLKEDTKTFQKELVFDFNDKSKLPYFYRDFTPDNIEGMTWGTEEDGAPILYLVSDNNFSSKQISQLIKLKMVVDSSVN